MIAWIDLFYCPFFIKCQDNDNRASDLNVTFITKIADDFLPWVSVSFWFRLLVWYNNKTIKLYFGHRIGYKKQLDKMNNVWHYTQPQNKILVGDLLVLTNNYAV